MIIGITRRGKRLPGFQKFGDFEIEPAVAKDRQIPQVKFALPRLGQYEEHALALRAQPRQERFPSPGIGAFEVRSLRVRVRGCPAIDRIVENELSIGSFQRRIVGPIYQ